MLLRLVIPVAGLRTPALLIVRCADTRRVAGKYLAGRLRDDASQPAVVFDDSAAFHKDLAETYGLRPLGGGWCEIHHDARQIVLSNHSAQFGREPDRALAVALFQRAFPAYTCWPED